MAPSDQCTSSITSIVGTRARSRPLQRGRARCRRDSSASERVAQRPERHAASSGRRSRRRAARTRPRAASMNSHTRLVLPIPASPPTSTTVPSPRPAVLDGRIERAERLVSLEHLSGHALHGRDSHVDARAHDDGAIARSKTKYSTGSAARCAVATNSRLRHMLMPGPRSLATARSWRGSRTPRRPPAGDPSRRCPRWRMSVTLGTSWNPNSPATWQMPSSRKPRASIFSGSSGGTCGHRARLDRQHDDVLVQRVDGARPRRHRRRRRGRPPRLRKTAVPGTRERCRRRSRSPPHEHLQRPPSSSSRLSVTIWRPRCQVNSTVHTAAGRRERSEAPCTSLVEIG